MYKKDKKARQGGDLDLFSDVASSLPVASHVENDRDY